MRAWAALLALCVVYTARAKQPDFEDLEGRIDYAYFTEDSNALGNLIQALQGDIEKEQSTAAAYYMLAFAHYRRGLLLAGRGGKSASAAAFSACVDELDKVIANKLKSADIYALQAVCYGHLGNGRYWQRLMDSSLGGWRMDKALELDAANPRVIFIDGLREYEGHKLLGKADKSKALERFRRAIEIFESQRHGATAVPTWGLADAYAWLGRGLMENGDTLGARNAFERALIVAPEFAAARRDLRQLIEKSK